MTGIVALHHRAEIARSVDLRRASHLAEDARLGVPPLHRRARRCDDPGAGRAIQLNQARPRTLAVVARLWLGVLSIFALIVLVGLSTIVLGAWVIGYQPVVVTSGSMGPAIRVGDVVITKDAPPDEELGTQTVVTFDDPANGEQVLHRIIEVTPDGYRTKGDANASADAEIVDPTQVRGAGLMLAPYVGYAAVWVQEAAWPQLAALLVALAALAAMSRQTWMWSAGR